MYDRILIAYDASKEAERALVEGCKLANLVNAAVTVVTVAEPLPGFYNVSALASPEAPQVLHNDEIEDLTELQKRAVAYAASQGRAVDTILLVDDEIPGILEAARTSKADLIVMGLHRHTRHIEWAGTVRQVANESPCSILAVV
jgi:nucleotide-binding universal stress UspA family protein